ncbi:hypothetical protein PANDA_015310 [Ailuropoda melanoleuca]|uniref:Uncharacterized protein n=1 Tax=Ailuropoda melanoleuca TaxID=9646 RepID=D2HT57_AILME|nr:hypothetical protein PANDA_015310 [Ailuropoda melanoleuca]
MSTAPSGSDLGKPREPQFSNFTEKEHQWIEVLEKRLRRCLLPVLQTRGRASQVLMSGSPLELNRLTEEQRILNRSKRGWVWNQMFVLEEFSGPEPILVGRFGGWFVSVINQGWREGDSWSGRFTVVCTVIQYSLQDETSSFFDTCD